MPFFITLSRNICFTTVTHLANRKTATIFAAFKSIFMYYLQKGFQIITVTADNEIAPFGELMYELTGAPTLNLTSANEHEPYIEGRIRVVKERTRAVRPSIPFTQIPVKMLNYFPAKGGVSDYHSPKTLCHGKHLIISNALFHLEHTAKSIKKMDSAIASLLAHRVRFQLALPLIDKEDIFLSP